MGFLSAKELRKKRFSFRKSSKKDKENQKQEKQTSQKDKANNKRNKNAKSSSRKQLIQQKDLEPPEAAAAAAAETTTTTPRTVVDNYDDVEEMTGGGGGGGGGIPGSPERNINYTRSSDTRDPPVDDENGVAAAAAAAGGELRSKNHLLGQINVVEDDNFHDGAIGHGSVAGAGAAAAAVGGGDGAYEQLDIGTEIVVGKIPSQKRDPEGNNIQNSSANATDSIPYNPNEINNTNDNDDFEYDEYPADELRQTLSAPMMRSSSSGKQQQRHVAERTSLTNSNNNHNHKQNRNNYDDHDHVLKADPPLVSSKSIDLGDLKDNAEYTARKLLGVFNCVPEDIQQKTYRAVEGVGTAVETGCEMPDIVCQGTNTKQEKRGIKRNLSFYNDQFAVKFLDEILNVGFAVIHHVQSDDGDWSGRSATLILRPGTCNANNHSPPRLEWSSMGGGTQSHIETDSVSLLQIHSLTSSAGEDDDDDDSFNNDDDEEREELQCIFTLTTTEGIIEVFEAITPDETAKLVTGIKNISAKFAQQLISGDEHAFTDYYSQHSETDFIKLTPSEAMSLMTHDFLDSL